MLAARSCSPACTGVAHRPFSFCRLPRFDAELTAPLTRRESYSRIYKEAACVNLKLLVMQLSAQSVLGAAICAVGGGAIIPFRLTTALDSARHTFRSNTSEGHVSLYETYRGMPTRFQSITKAVNIRIRITFIVQSTKHRVAIRYRNRHPRLISTLHRVGILHCVSLSRRVGIVQLIGPLPV